MATTIYPDKYLQLLNQSTKQLSVVIEIEGVGDFLSNVPIFEKIRYGDPGVDYGTPGVVYGGLRLVPNSKPYLQLDSGMMIGNKIEPEQGRASISTLSLSFIDKDGYMSRLISPGVVVNEPLGNKAVRIWAGFANSAFKEDYFVVFRGFISGTTSLPGKVILKISDPNFKRKAQVFLSDPSQLSAPVAVPDTSVTVNRTDGFFKQILGPALTYDPAVKTYLQISDEVMTYPPTGIVSPTVVNVLRGGGNSRGTTVATHAIGDDVTNTIQIQDHPINVALKLMLSGWNGPFVTGIGCRSIGNAQDPSITNTRYMILVDQSVDLKQDLGLSAGDTVTVSGSAIFANNQTFVIANILDAGGFQNRLIITTTPLQTESPVAPSTRLAFRSKYDTLPTLCGLMMRPSEVDVETHEYIRDNYLLGLEYTVQLYITGAETGKDFIESECFLPFGLYSIIRYGRCSTAITKPPIADQKLQFVDPNTILDPQNVTTMRAVDNRRYYNEIVYYYDLLDDGQTYRKVLAEIDSTSLTNSTVMSPLVIRSSGLKSSLGAAQVVASRGRFLLNRYKNGAIEITFKVNWKSGATIEVGDAIVLVDNGFLKVTNFATGLRDLGVQPWEVIQRMMNLKDGQVTITLLGGVGFNLTDRYAGISPSSLISSGATTTSFKIVDSFGSQFPGNESKKWSMFGGQQIWVHSPDYTTRSGFAILKGVNASDKYRLDLSTALPFTPQVNDVLEVSPYPLTDPSPATNQIYKTLYAFLDPTLTVVTGISQTQFTVSAPDAALAQVGQFILVHNQSYSILSPESKVVSVVGTTITVALALGFTPSAGQEVELVGFKDGGGPYRQV